MANAMYLRKSRAEESASTEEVLANHKAALVALAVKKGIIVTDMFEEVVSGESLSGRPEMLKLLKGVQSGAYDTVLCMDIDRLGRGGMADQGVILDAFRYSETLIVTPDKTYDLLNESDEELTEFKAFMARREYKMIRKRMKRGLMQTVEKGGYVSNAPYGYERCTVNKMPTLKPIEEEARFVRFIFSQYNSGIGAQSIARDLNSMGSVPHRGAEWQRSTVRLILQNPTYTGKVVWNRVKCYKPGQHGIDKHHVKCMPPEEWIVADGLHPPIISEDEFKRAQEIRAGRFIPSQRVAGHTANPFSGLIVCSVCGHKMQRMGDNKGEAYILCNTTGCQAGAKAEYVEEHLLSALEDMLRKIRITAKAEAPTDEMNTYTELLSSIANDISKLEARIPRLYDFLEDGTYDRDTFRARMEAVEKERNTLSKRQLDLSSELESIKSRDMTKTTEKLETALALYPALNVDEKNMLLKSVIDKIEYTKDKKTKPRDFVLTITLRRF